MEFGNEFNENPVTLIALSTLPHVDLSVPHTPGRKPRHVLSRCKIETKHVMFSAVFRRARSGLHGAGSRRKRRLKPAESRE